MNATIACCLWEPNEGSFDFSTMYDETWVEKLYRGFARNLSLPFEFVCWSDIDRDYTEPAIEARRLWDPTPGYGSLIDPFSTGAPTIICGLDTIVTGNCDHLVEYCLKAKRVAVPRDPFFPDMVCNGVVLAPAGNEWIWREKPQGANDMDWLRQLSLQQPERFRVIDDLWPGQVVSYKGHAKHYGPGDARIVYFHGAEKPHELDVDWISEAWR